MFLKSKLKRKLILTMLGVLLGIIIVGGLIVNIQGASAYNVNYVIQNDWGSGANVNVTITNTGTSPINGWTLTWTFSGNQKITNLWNGTYTQSGTAVTVKNAAYNSTIAVNSSVSFGFGLTYSGSNTVPTNFVLNGETATVSVIPSASPSQTVVTSAVRTTSTTTSTAPATTSTNSGDAWESNVGTINLGTSITYTGTGVSVSGSTVNIATGGDFAVTGTLSNGMIKINTADKCKLRLSGCNITNSSGPAIYVENAEKAFITITENTTNTLADGRTYSDQNAKGTIFSNDDLEIKGNGTLNITGNYKHAISGDDDVIIENGNIKVSSAVSDCIHANASANIKGGTLNLTATGDCIQSEDEGVIVDDGTLNLSAGSQAIVSDTSVTINGGTINATKCSEGIQSKLITITGGSTAIRATDDALNGSMGARTETNDGSKIVISGGTMYLGATSGDSVDANGTFTMTGGNIACNAPTSGANVAMDVNGSSIVSGGIFIAASSNSGMNEYPNGASQYSLAVMLTSAQSANSIICVKDSTGKELVKFKAERSFYSVIFSSPELKLGSTYTIYTGGTVSGGTDFNGLYTGGTYSGGNAIATVTLNTTPTTTSGNFGGMGR